MIAATPAPHKEERTPTEQTHSEPFSIYVHIPFCKTLCTYCAFNTYAGLEDSIEPYLAALEGEMALIGDSSRLTAHTLYFGGGTPSLLTPSQVASVIDGASLYLGLSADAEISLEANPGSLDRDKLAGYRAAGVSRLSMGVQSAHADELMLFGRRHTFAEAAEAFRLAREAGFDNINLDLIYGAPGQTLQLWRESLRALLEWQPQHLSLYSLTLESGTSLERRVRDGLLPSPDSDLSADMYDEARALLDKAGFRHYEISNWALPGYECRHNLQYWLNEPFIGVGAGAHGATRHMRYWNVRPVERYIGRINTGRARQFPLSAAADGFEAIDPALEMAETVILGLRLLSDGLDKSAFARRFGQSVESIYGAQIESLQEAGLLTSSPDALHLTERAYLVSNRVMVHFMP